MYKRVLRQLEGQSVVLRFTGKAGGTEYVYDDGKSRLSVGQTVQIEAVGHWLALLASGDAEIVK